MTFALHLFYFYLYLHSKNKQKDMGSAKYLIAKESDYRWGAVISTIGIQETPAGEPYPYGEHPKGLSHPIHH